MTKIVGSFFTAFAWQLEAINDHITELAGELATTGAEGGHLGEAAETAFEASALLDVAQLALHGAASEHSDAVACIDAARANVTLAALRLADAAGQLEA